MHFEPPRPWLTCRATRTGAAPAPLPDEQSSRSREPRQNPEAEGAARFGSPLNDPLPLVGIAVLDEQLGAASPLARVIELRQHLGCLLRLVQREQPRDPSALVTLLLQQRRALILRTAG